MRDQGSVGKESPEVKYDRALALFTESVLAPDHQLRGCAHNQGCFDELMEIRKHVLEYLKTLREVTHHVNPDESDAIESEKLMTAKTMQFMRTISHLVINGQKTRLLEALSHINSVDKLIIDDDYHGYMSGKLLMVEIELQRQLQKLTNERRRIPIRNKQHLNDAKQQRPELPDFTGTD